MSMMQMLPVPLESKLNVMKAVMLRDIRTRFFNHGFGFLVVPVWPLLHMFLLLTIYAVVGRAAPYGNSLRLFFGTGLVPTLSFMYASRFMAVSLLANRTMMSFPVIKPADILHGRACLEIIASCLMAAMTFVILLILGDNPVPIDPLGAVGALATALVLAVGMGMIIGVIVLVWPFALTVYFLCNLIFYFTSGTMFVASALPSELINVLQWSPILQCVEWMRVSVIPGYPDQILDRGYAMWFALTILCLGFLVERLARRNVLSRD